MRQETNWDTYGGNPSSLLQKYTFFNFLVKAYERLLRGVKFNQPIKVLELGCGTGYTNLFLAKRFPVKKMTVVDFNPQMIKVARKALDSLIFQKEFINDDFFKIKLRGKYDLVHSQGVVEHFEEEKRRELLKKHVQATKRGGYCLIFSPTPTKAYWFFRKVEEILGLWLFTDEVPLKKEVIIQEMASLGMASKGVDFFWRYYLTEVGLLFQKS